MKKNIILIGMMGAGKSTIAKALSNKLNYEFIDTDERIEKENKKTITQIFKLYGEAHFRKLEAETIKKLMSLDKKVISTGGGSFQNIENIKNLKQIGIVFYLQTPIEISYERIKNSTNRPLLLKGNPLKSIENLLFEREKNYQKADFIIETNNKTIEQITEEIIQVYNANS